MSMHVPKDCKSINMNDLIASAQQYSVQGSHVCDKCNIPMKLRTHIVDAIEVLVIKLDVWSTPEDGAKAIRRTTSINSVPTSSLKVGDKMFTSHSTVHLLSNKSAGFSYISIVCSSSKWIHCNNQDLSYECWPKGAKNLYLAFYSHSVGGAKQSKSKPEASQFKFTPHATAKHMPSSKQNFPNASKLDKASFTMKTQMPSSKRKRPKVSNCGNTC